MPFTPSDMLTDGSENNLSASKFVFPGFIASGRVNWTTNGPTKSNGASTVTISIKEYENHAPDTVKWTLPSGAQIQPGGQSGGYRASRMVMLSFIS